MKQKNHYEDAFTLWLSENNYRFSHIKQTDRLKVADVSVKSFDYIVDTEKGSFIVELKGRKFGGNTLENLRGLQNWVTADDVQCLCGWQSTSGASALFVFSYQLADYFADIDGFDTIELNDSKYAFVAVKLDDYKQYMKPRSERWQTVHLHAEDFRTIAKKVSDEL